MMEQTTSSPVSEENCNKLLFRDLCMKFEQMQHAKGSEEKLSLIFNRELKKQLDGHSIFPLLRLLLPLNDSYRHRYGLKQATAVKTYINALNLVDSSKDATRLKFWKNPLKMGENSKGAGDFGSVLEDVLQSRIRVEYSSVTIGEVNSILDAVSAAIGDNAKANVIRTRILNVFNAVEQKWLMRIIFQDLKIGLKVDNVLKSLSETSLQTYNECTDLKRVCEELCTGGSVSTVAGLQVFTAFSPMLAKRFKAGCNIISETENAMGGRPFYMDIKLDGERMMVHIRDGQVMLWTRKGNNYTDKYRVIGADIVRQIHRNVRACILDGEICAWDNNLRKMVPFGSNRTVAKAEVSDDSDSDEGTRTASAQLFFVAFDIVYLEMDNVKMVLNQHAAPLSDVMSHPTKDPAISYYKRCAHDINQLPNVGGSIKSLPLILRRALLSNLLIQKDHRVEIVQHQLIEAGHIAERKRRLESFFNTVVERGEEGLVVKDALSSYEVGTSSKTKGFWVKVKPDYSDMTTDLDLLVLGAYYGEGMNSRGQGLSTFLCGVIDDDADGGTKYKSVCKVGTGYNFDELKQIREKIEPYVVQWDQNNRQNMPPHFSPWSIAKLDDVPHVWIPPEQSIVFELKCYEITTSSNFAAGYTCRFPRVSRIRFDKDYTSVLTMSGLREVIRNPRINSSAPEKRPAVKRKTKAEIKPRSIVPSQFALLSTQVVADDDLFRGSVFCVMESVYGGQIGSGWSKLLVHSSDNARSHSLISRQEIINRIKRHGGEVVANPVPQCKIIIGDKSYIVDAIRCHRVVLKSGHIVRSANVDVEVQRDCDIFGDSFVEPIVETELEALLQQVDTVMMNHTASKNSNAAKRSRHASANISTLHRDLQQKDWVQIAQQYYEPEELEFLDMQYNIFWRNNTLIYVDVFSDFGEAAMLQHLTWKDIVAMPSAVPQLLPYSASLLSIVPRLLLYGAQVSMSLTVETTHVIVNPVLKSRLLLLKEKLREFRLHENYAFEKRVVNVKWAEECIATNTMLIPNEEHIVQL